MSRFVCALRGWRLCSLAAFALLCPAATGYGQGFYYGAPPTIMQVGYCAAPGGGCCYPCYPPSYAPSMAAPATPRTQQDVPPDLPPSVVPDTQTIPSPMAEPSPSFAMASTFTQATGGGGGFSVPNTYIDPAQVFTHFRLRFDAAFDNPIPDRAEYFYAKCGCFRNPALAGPLLDPNAKGPPLPETGVDYQDIRAYLEVAVTRNVSGFVELPFRFLDPEVNDDTSGLADMNAGVKAVLLTNGEDYLTFQLAAYVPTGDADRGLGTAHATIEPALLFYEQHTDRLAFYGETRYWCPLGGSNFAGNIVRYGFGTAYDIAYASGGNEKVTALAEFVGWTIIDGGFFDANNPNAGVQDAGGDTILNLKLGLRYTLGQGSVAASWGHGLTGDIWYEDIFRCEYRRAF